VARATHNEYFERVLATIRTATTARAVLRFNIDGTSYVDIFIAEVQREHADIAEAISNRHEEAARACIERHLGGRRYAALLAAAEQAQAGQNPDEKETETEP
jgi:DNA-binding FadR family transcriptional regulator